jgi:hypothetical protein
MSQKNLLFAGRGRQGTMKRMETIVRSRRRTRTIRRAEPVHRVFGWNSAGGGFGFLHDAVDHHTIWRYRLEGLLASAFQVECRGLSFLGNNPVAL